MLIAEKRGNTYISVGASVSRFPHIASGAARTVENKEESVSSALASPHRIKASRLKPMCRQKLRNEVQAARNLALSCLPNRACKVNSLLRFFTISPNKQRSFLAASIASSVRHQRGNDLRSPGGVHAFLRVQHQGCRMLFIRFVNRTVQQSGALITEDGSRQEIADIPRFAAPPGDAHRARGSRYCLLFN
jgi:hypothetical protein